MKSKSNAPEKEQILITGNSSSFGRLVTKRLLKEPNLHIIGVDQRPFLNPPADLEQYSLDLRRKSAYDLLRKRRPSVIIHLGVIRSPQKHRRKGAKVYYFNLESTAQLLRLSEQLEARKFVYLSTANLYGPSANTAGLLHEDAPLHGANRSPDVRDLVSLDMMVQSFFWKNPNTETVILRPCHVVGPHLKNAPSRYLQLEMIPTVLGFDPMVQMIHESDVVEAIRLSLAKGIRGIFNLAVNDAAPLSRIIAALERPTTALPERLLGLLLQTAFIYRRSLFPPSEMDHMKYPCLVDISRSERELHFVPKKTLTEILDEAKNEFLKTQEKNGAQRD